MNNTVFIAGASSGIGRSLSELNAAAGSHLQLASRNLEALQQQAIELRSKYNVTVEVFYLDVTNSESIKSIIHHLKSVPDVVICSVGYLGNDDRELINEEELDKIFATNTIGCIKLLNVFAALFKKSGKGTLVGISSIAGDRGKSKNLFYSAAKAGFTSYLDGLRNELYPFNVHVVTVKPGYVDTPMTKGLQLPNNLIISSEKAASIIMHAVERKKNVVYVPGKWRLIMCAIKAVPEWMYKKIKWK